jgi:hypothetical protein
VLGWQGAVIAIVGLDCLLALSFCHFHFSYRARLDCL